MLLAVLRDAPWLTCERIRGYAAILIGFYCLVAVWAFSAPGLRDRFDHPKGTDFVSFWTVSSALHHGQSEAIYRPEELAALERTVTGGGADFYAWAYPPIALLIVYPLALLPYFWSLAFWLTATLALYLGALWRILPQRLALGAGLAFPAAFVTLAHGQNALLSAGLLGTALALLQRRPGLAGTLLGVLAFKPQLGVLVPIALLCGGHWRAISAAVLTIAVMCLAALLLFGAGLWADFIASAPFAQAMLEQGWVPYYKLQSTYAAVRLLGGSLAVAYAAQAIVTVAAAAVTAWTWQRPVEQDVKNAVLVTAGLMATPFVLDYDLTLLALPIAWLAAAQLRGATLPWERSALVAAYAAPLIARPLAGATSIGVTPVILAALLLALCVRCQAPARALLSPTV